MTIALGRQGETQGAGNEIADGVEGGPASAGGSAGEGMVAGVDLATRGRSKAAGDLAEEDRLADDLTDPSREGVAGVAGDPEGIKDQTSWS